MLRVKIVCHYGQNSVFMEHWWVTVLSFFSFILLISSPVSLLSLSFIIERENSPLLYSCSSHPLYLPHRTHSGSVCCLPSCPMMLHGQLGRSHCAAPHTSLSTTWRPRPTVLSLPSLTQLSKFGSLMVMIRLVFLPCFMLGFVGAFGRY